MIGKRLLTIVLQRPPCGVLQNIVSKRGLPKLSRPLWFILIFSLFVCHYSFSATYYVRTDGGTATQCTGTADAPYPGSGNNRACAWSHPFFALDSNGQWKLRGGDTLIIGPGTYMMGYGAPNTGPTWCEAEGAYECHLPPLPSGSPNQPTRILGKDWDQGCSSPPTLWGTQRATTVVDLRGTSHAEIQCLEITDRATCGYAHPTVPCQYDRYPYGEWAAVGITAHSSSHVTLKNLNIHGLGDKGILAGGISDWLIEDVRVAGNAWAGWDGDVGALGVSSSNSGSIVFRRVIVEWNGCVELPNESFSHCWAQSAGGYGDGLGTAATGGSWIFDHVTFRYNTSDGLDLLYLGRNTHGEARAEIRDSFFYGNAGNQLKVGSNSLIVNSVVVGNCGYFFRRGFSLMGPRDSGDHCRALGSPIAISLQNGDSSYIVNSTLAGEGDVIVSVECDREFSQCSGREGVMMYNNIFLGNTDFLQPFERSAYIWDPENFVQEDYNNVFGVKNISGFRFGTHDIIQDPRLAQPDLDNFDGHLTSASPAIDRGLPVGSLSGLVPSYDVLGVPRPTGNGVDLGAYEYTNEPVTDPYMVRIQQAYVAYYGRWADPGGLDYWAERLRRSNGDLRSLIDAFGNSQEFQSEYGHLSYSQLIDTLYRQMFNLSLIHIS
ncbi:MAG: right-handed parallel beta-helix repeat-containing protein, partial [Syntrophobacterales bacterium]|nr:right-handed parallel beta-helix repeat-containing protein [Syntrophobacterales bacterium]